MKTIISLLICITLIFSLSACTKPPVVTDDSEITATTPDDSEKKANMTDSQNINVAEFIDDDIYGYIFYNDNDTPSGIMARYMNDADAPEKERRELTEQEAIAQFETVLLKYCPSYTLQTQDRFKMEVRKSYDEDFSEFNGFPAWRIILREYTQKGIRRNTLVAEIDVYGLVASASFGIRSSLSDDELDSIDAMDEEQAVSAAISIIQDEGINIEQSEYDVETELFEAKQTVWWDITFHQKQEFSPEPGGYSVSLHAETAEPMNANLTVERY